MSSRNLFLALAGSSGVKVLPDLDTDTASVGNTVGVKAISGGNVQLGFSAVGAGSVTKISTTGPGITGGDIVTTGTLAVQWNAGPINTLASAFTTTSGTLDLATTGVAPGTYSLATISVDARGRLTGASSGSAPGGGATLTVADTPPTLTQGALWFDSVSTQLMVGYVDPSGAPGQWVVATNPGAMLGGAYLPLSGGALTGDLTLFRDPTAPLHAASKSYIDTALAPYAPLASPPLTGTPTAPTPTVGDSSTKLATTAFVATAIAPVQIDAVAAQQIVGRNKLHNGLFNIAQRGLGPFTASGYTLDRWYLLTALDTVSVTSFTISDPARVQIGDEAALFGLQAIVTGNAGAGSYTQIQQKIENVWRLSGKTVTLSFWAVATSALKIGVNGAQVFGTGGSPSAPVGILTTGLAVTLSTTWTRYSMTFAIPSAASKIMGSNEDSYTQIQLFMSSGATNNVGAGNIGVQSGTFQIWGVQLEIAAPGQTQPSPLEKREPADELALCQRFYQQVMVHGLITAPVAASYVVASAMYAVPMHHAPTYTSMVYGSDVNVSGFTVDSINSLAFRSYCTTNTTGQANFSRVVLLSADL